MAIRFINSIPASTYYRHLKNNQIKAAKDTIKQTERNTFSTILSPLKTIALDFVFGNITPVRIFGSTGFHQLTGTKGAIKYRHVIFLNHDCIGNLKIKSLFAILLAAIKFCTHNFSQPKCFQLVKLCSPGQLLLKCVI
jgi:hypothetical protein